MYSAYCGQHGWRGSPHPPFPRCSPECARDRDSVQLALALAYEPMHSGYVRVTGPANQSGAIACTRETGVWSVSEGTPPQGPHALVLASCLLGFIPRLGLASSVRTLKFPNPSRRGRHGWEERNCSVRRRQR